MLAHGAGCVWHWVSPGPCVYVTIRLTHPPLQVPDKREEGDQEKAQHRPSDHKEQWLLHHDARRQLWTKLFNLIGLYKCAGCLTSWLWPGVLCDDHPLYHSHGLTPPLPVPGVHLEVHWLCRVKAGEKEPGLGPRHVPHQAAAIRQPDLRWT